MLKGSLKIKKEINASKTYSTRGIACMPRVLKMDRRSLLYVSLSIAKEGSNRMESRKRETERERERESHMTHGRPGCRLAV